MIPIGTRYSYDISGRAIKTVVCEQCRAEYIYACDRKARGEAVSYLWLDNDGARARAERTARQKLAKGLACGVEPIACPSCAWYQVDMVREARRRRGQWLVTVAIGTLTLAALLLLILWLGSGFSFNEATKGVWTVVGVAIVATAAALAARHFRSTIWDPNSDTLWKRKRKAKEAGKFMFKEDYDREYRTAAPDPHAEPPTLQRPPGA